MEQVGALILGFHRNLEEIRASLDSNAARGHATQEDAYIRSTVERAESALRAQARDFVAAAAATGGGAGAAQYWQPQRQPSPPAQYAQQPPRPRSGAGGLPPPAPASYAPLPPMLRAAAAEGGRVPGQRPLRPPARGARHRAKTTGAQRMLPKPNKLDPLSDPPVLSERDLEGGLYGLSRRGFIPPAADLTPAMERGVPVIQQRPAPLFDQAVKHARREIAMADDIASIRLDHAPPARLARSADELRRTGARPPVLGPAHSARALPPLSPRGPAPAASLPALPAPPLVEPPPTTTAADSGNNILGSFGTFCTELLDSAPDPSQERLFGTLAVPEPPGPELLRAAAATRIAAAWRGALARRAFAEARLRDRAARRIQSSWASAITRMLTKMQLHRIHEEDRQLHASLMDELSQDWFQAKQLKRVEVHICSLTVADARRSRMDSYQALQASQIGRIFRLMDPKRDVIFVAPKMLHEDVLDYYSKIMQFRGVRNPPGRFQVVVPEHMGLTDRLSLSQGLLCSPKALRRLRRLVSGRQAYIVPEAVTHTELKLSSALRLPLLGAGAGNLALMASKSHAKKLALAADVPIGPWAVDIYDEDEFYTSLAGLAVKHPRVRVWLFKIDDERDSRGHAYVDLSKMREASDAVQISAQARGDEGGLAEEPAIVGASADEVRQVLRRLVPRRVCLCNRRAYPDFGAWLAEASRVGAVIQAVPECTLAQTSVHLQLDPDGAVAILGTSEAVMSRPFVRAASYYPHVRGSWEVLQEVGGRVGRALATKGLVGFASVDVVFFENPDFDPARPESEREPTPLVIGGGTPVDPRHLMFSGLRSPSPEMSEDSRPCTSTPLPPSLPESRQADYDLALQLQDSGQRSGSLSGPLGSMLGASGGPSASSRVSCWVVDVDARLTDEAAALFPLQFIGQVRHDPASGLFRLTPDAPAMQDVSCEGDGTVASTPSQDGSSVGDASVRWAMVNRAAAAPELSRFSHQALFQAVKMRGVSFDLLHNVGCLFGFLDVVHGLFSFLAMERTAELCTRRLAAGVAALAEGPPKATASAARTKVSAPREAPQPGKEAENYDGLYVVELQTALRAAQKRWAPEGRR